MSMLVGEEKGAEDRATLYLKGLERGWSTVQEEELQAGG